MAEAAPSVEALAALHARAFVQTRAWTAAEFRGLLESPFATALYLPSDAEMQGFALIQTIGGESELLTVCVEPDHQRRGVGAALMDLWLAQADVTRFFLEVAADNAGAMALYHRCGFAEVARRKGYYTPADGGRVDAVILHLVRAGAT